MMNRNKIASAFMLIFLGELIFQIPIDTWSVKIMWMTAWIAMLIGTVSLYKQLQGIGRKAAGLWIAATVFQIVAGPLQVLESLAQGFSGIVTSSGSWGNMQGADVLQSVLEWGRSLGFLMFLAGTVLFLIYPPFAKERSGWIWLLVAFLMAMLDYLSFLLFIPQFIGFYLIIIHLYEDKQHQKRAGAFLWMSSGLLFSLLILLNNDLKYILVSALGLIFWLIGVNKIRAASEERRGTGAFLWYGALMFIASVLHIAPGFIGDILSVILQLPAYILLAVGFFRFSKTSVFYGNPNGMRTLGGMLIIAAFLASIYLIPLVGESLSGLGVALIMVPFFVISWKNGLSALPETDMETGEAMAVISLRDALGKHKFLKIVIVAIIVVSGCVFRGNVFSIPEKCITKALEFKDGNFTEFCDRNHPYRQEIDRLLKIAVLCGDYEAKAYYPEEEIDIKDIQRICKSADRNQADALYAIYLFNLNGTASLDYEAQKYLGNWYQKNKMDFITCLEKAAELGNKRAIESVSNPYQQCIFGKWYLEDWQSEKAKPWLSKSAEQGNARAQYYLGTLLNNSEGAEWLECAARQDEIWAFYELGKYYEKSNPQKAFSYYSSSAEKDVYSLYALAKCYHLGIGVKKNPRELKRILRKLSKMSYYDNREELGMRWPGWGDRNYPKRNSLISDAESKLEKLREQAEWYNEMGKYGYTRYESSWNWY